MELVSAWGLLTSCPSSWLPTAGSVSVPTWKGFVWQHSLGWPTHSTIGKSKELSADLIWTRMVDLHKSGTSLWIHSKQLPTPTSSVQTTVCKHKLLGGVASSQDLEAAGTPVSQSSRFHLQRLKDLKLDSGPAFSKSRPQPYEPFVNCS